jgi:hypothetical protein
MLAVGMFALFQFAKMTSFPDGWLFLFSPRSNHFQNSCFFLVEDYSTISFTKPM